MVLLLGGNVADEEEKSKFGGQITMARKSWILVVGSARFPFLIDMLGGIDP